ncbi:DUF4105 domain-containing protein [Lysobacter sp. H21R4]|uniref:lipoprotein N-acyltransferase Lnb domain-containing protein n=1 Tax=Lysobacter sp. H21R4 TaxID=2781021 RepID=UPI00188958AF|nr:DUF4105 domain-containing protein [Lysobacter sp. H21R4]QOY63493.1 DUF4105 domain-containing protein [Lysobacter sp. H21R4]
MPEAGAPPSRWPALLVAPAHLVPRLLLLVALLLCGFTAAAAPRIGVVTMQPGEIFFERFGHNAILVDDPAKGTAISYNFGYFDPTEPDFIARFIRGDMRYQLVALPLEDDLAYYRDVGRGVSLQWLNLPPADAAELAAALAENARPENAHYRYDYFLDNCSTRVRDALDRALDGGLARQMGGSRGDTFRSEATRLASPDLPMWLGFDLGLGPAADQPLSNWGDAFVPMRLAASLRDAHGPDGAPLVAEERELLPHRLDPEPAETPRRWWLWLLAGVIVGGALAWAGRLAPRAVAGLALPFWALSGVIGALMLFIWFATAHRFGWANYNLLLMSPLAWALLPGGWRLTRGRAPGRWFDILLRAMPVLATIGLFTHWLQSLPQQNLHWIVLVLPLHVGLMLGLRTR